MMPLAAADCLLNARSLSMVSDQQNIMRRASVGEESKGGAVSQDLNQAHASEYVDNLLASTFSTKAYETDIESQLQPL